MTLILTLKKFRFHHDYHIELEPGVTQLSGANGVGKSTVAAAARWCLYGSLRRVTPRDIPRAKTSVLLRYVSNTTITVNRVRGGRLSYQENDDIWEGEEAQARIMSRFGSETMWMSTCYVPQKRPHPLISGNSADVTALVYSLTSLDEDPRKIADKLSSGLASSIKERDRLRDEVKRSGSCDHDSCPETTRPDPDPARKSLTAATDRLIQLNREKSRVQSTVQTAEKRNRLQLQLDQISVTQSSSSLRLELEEAKRCETTSSRRALLESNLASLPSTIYSLEELNAMQRAWVQCDLNAVVLAKYSLVESEVESRISSHEQLLIRHRDYTDRMRRRESISKELSRVEEVSGDQVRELRSSIVAQRERLNEIKVQLTSPEGMMCPVCRVRSMVKDGCLVVGGLDRDSITSLTLEKKQLLAELKEKETRVEVMDSAFSARTRLNRELESIPVLPVASSDMASEASRELIELKQLTLTQQPALSKEEIESGIARHRLQRELASMPHATRPLLVVENELREADRRDSLRSELASLPSTLPLTDLQSSLESICVSLAETEEEIRRLGDTISSMEEQLSLYHSHQHCSSQRSLSSSLVEVENRTSVLSRAVPISLNVYHDMVTQTIRRLNELLAFICLRLYDKDILIKIVSIRAGEEVNGRSRQRTTMELKAVCDGMEDDIESLSGGEETRASLIVSLAVAVYSSPLFLILDEPFSGVTLDWHDAALDLLKELIPLAPTLLITHSDVGSSINKLVALK